MIAERLRRALIVSSVEKSIDFFDKSFGKNFEKDVAVSATEAKQKLLERDYEIVLINAPLKDEFGTELAENIVKDSYAGVIMLVKQDVYEDVCFGIEKIGVYCMMKPLSVQTFRQGLQLAVATNERLKGLIKKTQSLKDKMEEIKLVGRAKLLLITKMSFSEEQAHKYIEKQAMDRCVKKSAVAWDVIKTYGD